MLCLAAGVSLVGRATPPGERLLATLLQQQGLSWSQRQSQVDWVNQVGARLAQAARPGLIWRFHLVDDPVPQAYAPGDGVVVVSEGLLDLGLNEDELAGILAHEMVHRLRGHVIVCSVPENEADRRSNHNCELEADALGRSHARRAGYSATGLENALSKILWDCDPSLTEESLTHPSLVTRIEALDRQP